METWKKYLIITVILVSLVVFLTLAAVNFQGIGDKLGGIGGPFTNGLTKLGAGPLNWALIGGYQMLIFYLVSFALVPVLVAYVVWHYDIPYKIVSNSTADNKLVGYNAQREPEDAETLNTSKTGAKP